MNTEYIYIYKQAIARGLTQFPLGTKKIGHFQSHFYPIWHERERTYVYLYVNATHIHWIHLSTHTSTLKLLSMFNNTRKKIPLLRPRGHLPNGQCCNTRTYASYIHWPFIIIIWLFTSAMLIDINFIVFLCAIVKVIPASSTKNLNSVSSQSATTKNVAERTKSILNFIPNVINVLLCH